MTKHRIVIKIADQEAKLFDEGRLVKTYKISSALNGIGTDAGSFRTPHGVLKVAQKIGYGEPVGSVFKARVPVGKIWDAGEHEPTEDDLVLTRILWLEGAEAHNANTLERFIYLHGTNQEALLGTPVSHGCIRLSNLDVLELFDLVAVGTEVEILA
jgi:L,D-transpeptidase YbiS